MNYFYQLICSISIGAISFGISLFIARHVGVDNFGSYSTAMAIGAIIAIPIDGGMRNLLTRERTRLSNHLEIFNRDLPRLAMGHSLLLSLIASIFCILYFQNYFHLPISIIWCFWGIVISQFASALLRGDGKFKQDSIWQLKQRVLSAAIIGVTVAMGYHSSWQLLLAWAAASIFGNLFLKNGFCFKPLFKPLMRENFQLYRALIPLLWIDLATTIYFRVDLILLKYLNVPDSDIGEYAAAYRLIEAAVLIAGPISLIIFRNVRLLDGRHSSQKIYIIRSLVIGILFGIVCSTLIQLIASPLVQLVYGDQYAQAAILLPILGWMVPLLIPNTVLTQAALALNLEKSYALIATLAALGNLSLNFFFIPRYGTLAAALSSIATELIILTGLSLVIYLKTKENQPHI